MDIEVYLPNDRPCVVKKLFVKKGKTVNQGAILCDYQHVGSSDILKLRSPQFGTITDVLAAVDSTIDNRVAVFKVRGCLHPIVMKDMCAECGEDLREKYGRAGDRKEKSSASVAMVHSIPELVVSNEQAVELGKADEERLLSTRKLVLLVDLDETLLHTTNDNVPPNLKDVYHFQLQHGSSMLWYHTKFRPGTKEFLEKMSKLYELHICTFGARVYAHTMAGFLDPERRLFSHRILSRDECFDPRSKQANLKALFPCGDGMVSIIDDREEVWKFTPNMIKVKPYHFFAHTADINAPPGLERKDKDTDNVSNRVVKIHKVPKKKKESDKDTTEDKDSDKKENESDKANEKNNKETTQALDGDGDKEYIGVESETAMETEQKEISSSGDNFKSVTEKSNVNSDDNQDISVQLDNQTKETAAMKTTESNEKEAVSPASDDAMECIEDIVSKEKVDSTQDTKSEENSSSSDDSEHESSEDDESKEDSKKTKRKTKKDGKDDEEYDEIIEWEDTDDYLLYLETILTQVHEIFFDMHDEIKRKKTKVKEDEKPNLKKIVPYAKKKVLQGVNVVFSGVVPTNMPLERSRPYAIAKNLGAQVQTELVTIGEKRTTHVIAAKKGTVKVNEALKSKDITVVKPEWLWACEWRWERVDERLYLLDETKQINNSKQKQNGSSMKRKAPSSNSLQKEDDVKRVKKAESDTTKLKRKASESSLNSTNSKDAPLKEKRSKISSGQETHGGLDISPQEIAREILDQSQPSTSGEDMPLRRFSDSINPLAMLSQEDLDDLNKEVDDMSENESDSDTRDTPRDGDASDDESSDSGDGDKKEDGEEEELGSGDDLTLRQQVLGLSSPETSDDESMSGDYPQGWRPKSKSPTRYDDNSHLLTIEDPHEAKAALLRAAQTSNHFLFEEESRDSVLDGRTDDDSQDSGDDELAAAVERGLFS